ncbi:MAG: HAD hydrolase-like protein [Proteobacteria bacterium]|nr:HAD hydrolase-like protein [Pseudomonadota bacterium]
MDSGLSRFKAIAFDFDGVILESVAIKTEAMRTLFAAHPAHVDEIAALHERHAGFSRFVKFDMIYRDLFKMPLAPESRTELGQKFSKLVLEKVLACPFVAGAREFFEAHYETTPLFIVSGTPDEELLTITSERGLSPYFKGIYGSDRGKPEILNAILAEHGLEARDLVFVGDGLTDFDAAKATSVPFIGRVPKNHDSPFPTKTRTIYDLTGLDRALEDLVA